MCIAPLHQKYKIEQFALSCRFVFTAPTQSYVLFIQSCGDLFYLLMSIMSKGGFTRRVILRPIHLNDFKSATQKKK